MDHDDYFIATRILLWQLLHDPETKTKGVDVLIISNPDVSEARRERLRKDGATVRVVDFVHGEHDDWVVPKFSRWAGIMEQAARLGRWRSTRASSCWTPTYSSIIRWMASSTTPARRR